MEVSVTATGARSEGDGVTAGDDRGLPQIVVVVVAVVSVAGEPVVCPRGNLPTLESTILFLGWQKEQQQVVVS